VNIKAAIGGAAVLVATLGTSVLAQDTGPAVVGTAMSEEYGTYLADAEGHALYLFTNDVQGTADMPAVSNCTGGCLAAWPPLLTMGDPTVDGEAMADLLGTIALADGTMQVTYNGWPLYYFAADMEADGPTGHERGDVWYLVQPSGEQVGAE